MNARSFAAALGALAALAAASPAAANPATYSVGTLPVSPGVVSVEVPLGRGFAAEGAVGALGQGTFEDRNPFAHLGGIAPAAWLHWDGVPNLRLSASFQEIFWQEVGPTRAPSWREDRGVLRARLQQPRGAAALYEMLQVDVRNVEDAAGAHHLVFRPRLRVGQGFNLDAVRIHSLVLYQELALRFSDDGYEARAFEFFRAFAGYMWTTRRGAFVTVGVAGQIGLNPPATAYTFLLGPALAVTYRFRSRPAETPPAPPDVEMQ
ncbi:MAG TPA: hypothetical protein VFL83_14460 [Anaeromyxobacter sp.]|nr:hypothetical protein [Anaeromyxobacter sp.]